MVSDKENTDPVEDDDDEDSEGGFEVDRNTCLQFANMDKLCGLSEEIEVTPDQMLDIVTKSHD